MGYNKRGNNLYLDNIWVYEGDEPVSIPELKLDNVTIYPNPTNNIITINIDDNTENVQLEIIDVLGKTVFQTNLKETKTSFNLNQYPNGVYIFKVSSNNISYTEKIIKQ